MNYINEMTLEFDSHSINEGFARSAVAAFCVQLNPTLDEITDIKTAVSEAVTNCVVHAYPKKTGKISIWVGLTSARDVDIKISDAGVGISDFEKAREPFFTTKPDEERAGMGFTVMESFMNSVVLRKNGDRGVVVEMRKTLTHKKCVALGGEND
ncbi:MAG: anti-sigma F factor [Clostridia bacterium]|nr:anti-sigma F factor [Clostridia bacterium]